MEQETKIKLRNYGICVGVEIVIGFLVVWSKGFFAHSTAVNLQILADAFFVSGLLMTLFAGLLYVSSEGVFIGLGYIMRSALRMFIPTGRMKYERYVDYRERKLSNKKKSSIGCVVITGLVFLFIGIVLTVIWYKVFYTVS